MTNRKLRILFDANPLVGQKTGVGYYTEHLILALASHHTANVELVGYYSSFRQSKHPPRLPAAPNIRYRKVYMPAQVINLLRRFRIELPVELLALTRGDFVLYPNFLNQPSLFRAPSAQVIHDLTFVDLPEYVSRKNLQDLLRFIPTQIKRSKFLVIVSEYGKKRLHDVFQVPTGNIIVTPIPPEEPRIASASDERQTLNKLGINGKFILTLGTVEPRKNLLNMLDAYLQLPEDVQKEYTFVSAGKIGWNCEAEVTRLTELQKQGKNIIRVGYVDETERAALYHNAELFTWASHYEGFGMPILEAMSYGTPCAISDIPVFREVAHEAALYFDQGRSESISNVWLRILRDPKLRERLSTEGKKRVELYRWDEVAASLYNRIEQTLKASK